MKGRGGFLHFNRGSVGVGEGALSAENGACLAAPGPPFSGFRTHSCSLSLEPAAHCVRPCARAPPQPPRTTATSNIHILASERERACPEGGDMAIWPPFSCAPSRAGRFLREPPSLSSLRGVDCSSHPLRLRPFSGFNGYSGLSRMPRRELLVCYRNKLGSPHLRAEKLKIRPPDFLGFVPDFVCSWFRYRDFSGTANCRTEQKELRFQCGPTRWGTYVAKGRALHTRYQSTKYHWTRL